MFKACEEAQGECHHIHISEGACDNKSDHTQGSECEDIHDGRYSACVSEHSSRPIQDEECGSAPDKDAYLEDEGNDELSSGSSPRVSRDSSSKGRKNKKQEHPQDKLKPASKAHQ